MQHMFHGSNFFWWIMPVRHVVIPVLVIYILFELFNNRGRVYRRKNSALGMLKERYARGEISRDEFHRIKDEIRD